MPHTLEELQRMAATLKENGWEVHSPEEVIQRDSLALLTINFRTADWRDWPKMGIDNGQASRLLGAFQRADCNAVTKRFKWEQKRWMWQVVIDGSDGLRYLPMHGAAVQSNFIVAVERITGCNYDDLVHGHPLIVRARSFTRRLARNCRV